MLLFFKLSLSLLYFFFFILTEKKVLKNGAVNNNITHPYIFAYMYVFDRVILRISVFIQLRTCLARNATLLMLFLKDLHEECKVDAVKT